MLRNVDLSEISDGKLYDANDMVKADCKGCEGCSACCRGMGKSIILDPLDVHRLTTGLGVPFEALLSQHVELNVVDGLILPNLRMTEGADACPFLNEQGRCSIHAYRPGICRLFPLGRFYDIRTYEQFISDWHYFLKALQERIAGMEDQAQIRSICMYVLQQFYLAPCEDFYEAFHERLDEAKRYFHM